jgi:hypothetical protein
VESDGRTKEVLRRTCFCCKVFAGEILGRSGSREGLELLSVFVGVTVDAIMIVQRVQNLRCIFKQYLQKRKRYCLVTASKGQSNRREAKMISRKRVEEEKNRRREEKKDVNSTSGRHEKNGRSAKVCREDSYFPVYVYIYVDVDVDYP